MEPMEYPAWTKYPDEELKMVLKLAENDGIRKATKFLAETPFPRQSAITLLDRCYPDFTIPEPMAEEKDEPRIVFGQVYLCGHAYRVETASCRLCRKTFGVRFRGPITHRDFEESAGHRPVVFRCGHPFVDGSGVSGPSPRVIFDHPDHHHICRACFEEDGIVRECGSESWMSPLEYFEMLEDQEDEG